MEEVVTYPWEAIIIGVVLVIQIVVQVVWVKFELGQLRKESEAMDAAIENKRESNIAKLREIYDLKISDTRAYSKGLFEQQNGTIEAMAGSIKGLEAQVQKILDILLNQNR